MSAFLDTTGRPVLGIGICDRCHFVFPLGELMPDRDKPGLMVCKEDRDVLDPWKLPGPPADKFNLPFVRPDANLALPPPAAEVSWTADTTQITADSTVTVDTGVPVPP